MREGKEREKKVRRGGETYDIPISNNGMPNPDLTNIEFLFDFVDDRRSGGEFGVLIEKRKIIIGFWFEFYGWSRGGREIF